MISIKRYVDSDKKIWNDFNTQSKNHLFMFDRDYMDYHSDRFKDHSLLFYDEGRLIALLPLNECENGLISHGGLTYGGFITNHNMKQHIMNDCFIELVNYAKKNNFTNIRYKCIPHIYCSQASEEDRYSLYIGGGKLDTIDVSTYLNISNPIKMSKGRKAQIARAKREGISIRELTELDDYKEFIDLENQVLRERHGVQAVHTGEELKLLHDRFPNNIHLISALKNERLLAGTVVYVYDRVIHTQYMAANDEGRNVGALDLAIATVIEKYKETKNWLDFGISTEHGRIYLNEGLCFQKESFGGRTGTYEIWNLHV